MNWGIFHLHQRKRKHKHLEPFPHSNKYKRLLDNTLLGVAVIGPMMNIPQIFKIYYYQNASSISLFSFSCFAFFNILWLMYGIVHKEKPIIIAYILWLITNIFIITGTVLYS
jgi:uncharacterized protein with PQ loop repeat